MNLRPYQANALCAILDAFLKVDRALAVLPTGSGKTILFSHLANHFQSHGHRTLILAHREELIDQAIEKLHAATGIVADKEKANDYASLASQVVVASVQSMTNARLARWPFDHFALIVCDEAHHSISDSWQRVLAHFRAKVLGVTATPDRGDKRELGEFYQVIAADIRLLDLINDGYLSKIVVKMLPLQIDIGAVKQVAGDYDAGGLGDALVPYLGAIAEAVKEHASFRRMLAFLPLIYTSQLFINACRAIGLNAEHIDGDSPDRKQKLKRFENGDTDILSNAMLLTEGYDNPYCDCILNLRVTRSRSLYSQIVGRGTRVAPGKENLLIFDFLRLSGVHPVCRPAHLVAQSESEADTIGALMDIGQNPTGDGSRQTQESGGPAAASDGGHGLQSEFDLCGLASEVTEQRHEVLRKRLDEQKRKPSKFISAEQFAIQLGDMNAAEYEPVMGWEREPMTDKQAKALRRNRIDLATVGGKGHASRLLGIAAQHARVTPASEKQKAMMRRMGVAHWDTATAADARSFFSAGIFSKGK